jgi:hypothetical protein
MNNNAFTNLTTTEILDHTEITKYNELVTEYYFQKKMLGLGCKGQAAAYEKEAASRTALVAQLDLLDSMFIAAGHTPTVRNSSDFEINVAMSNGTTFFHN